MKSFLNPRILLLFSYTYMICAVVVGILGAAVLWGWALDISILKSMAPNLLAMKPKTALAFVFISILLILKKSNHIIQRPVLSLFINIVSSLIIIIAIFTLLEWLWPGLNFDAWLFPSKKIQLSHISVEKIQPINSLLFILVAINLLSFNKKNFNFQQCSAVVVALGGIFGIIQIGFHLPFLTAGSILYTTINTAINFLMVGCSLFLLHPTQGICKTMASTGRAGKILRISLPTGLILLITLGYLHVIGLNEKYFDQESGLAILIISSLIIFIVIIFLAANQLMKTEINHQKHRMRFQIKERLLKRSLIVKQKELQRSNQDLEKFVYIASHDLQEPLRMVVNYTQLLSKNYGNQLEQKAKEFLHFAEDGAKRMQFMINNLLTYSQVETNIQQTMPVDCNLIIQNVLEDLKSEIANKKAHIYYESLPMVLAIPWQVQQVFFNLISNGLKFCNKIPEIHISVQEKSNCWQFIVEDNGIGIDEKNWGKIFLLFHHLNPMDKYFSPGIGLAICKKIVESHGGRIWVKSMIGKGSKFYFTILK